ncbi:hypothetical protein ACJX0J_029048 [Zea mays]
MIRACMCEDLKLKYLLSCEISGFFFNIIKTRLLAGYLYIHNSLHIQVIGVFTDNMYLQVYSISLPFTPHILSWIHISVNGNFVASLMLNNKYICCMDVLLAPIPEELQRITHIGDHGRWAV